MISRSVHFAMDSLMCGLMNSAQWKLRRLAVSRERLEAYLDRCETLDRHAYYALPEEGETLWQRKGKRLIWNSPVTGSYPENNISSADLYETAKPQGAPTLILLHALMSANDFGYRRIAERFNKRGWNVLFPHLPYHYSRRPKGYANGALTITSDLIRNAEALRQSVIELRQLIRWSRREGSLRVALLGTSYGGWVASLALPLEMTDFTVLLQPVADVAHATFNSPASRMMANLLKHNGIHADILDRHAHLSSPLNFTPLTPPDRILLVGGTYDRLSPLCQLKRLSKAWGGTRYAEVKQGHFGYQAMQRALAEAEDYLHTPCRMSGFQQS